MKMDPSSYPAPSQILNGVDAAANALEQLEHIASSVQELVERPEPGRQDSCSAPFHELRLLEQVIDNLSVHTEHDELLADAMSEVSTLVGSQAVWVVEASTHGALGPVHVLGELIIGDAELPRDVSRLCEDLFDRRSEACNKLSVPMPDGRTRVAMPIRVNRTYFGALIFTVDQRPPVEIAVRDRLLSSVLRFLAVSLENQHFIESLTEMIVEVVCGFSLAIESRDAYTGGHVMRVTAYALLLAERLGLSDEELSMIRLGGLLHDIGKVAIPDDILNKTDRLTDVEYDVMKVHPVVGHEILQRIPHLERANQIVRHHHERWDGRGYPDRLAGTDTPLLPRVLAIADSFDAMTSDRPYRQQMKHEAAMAEIERCAGTQFDPELAAAFIQLSEQDLAEAEARMHRWMHSKDHGDGLSLGHLIAMKKPKL